MTNYQHVEQPAGVPQGLLADQHLAAHKRAVDTFGQPARAPLATARGWRMIHQMSALKTASLRARASAPDLFRDGMGSLLADLAEYDAVSRDSYMLQGLSLQHSPGRTRPPLLH